MQQSTWQELSVSTEPLTVHHRLSGAWNIIYLLVFSMWLKQIPIPGTGFTRFLLFGKITINFFTVWWSQKEVQEEVLNASLINIYIKIYAYTSENVAPWLSSNAGTEPKVSVKCPFRASRCEPELQAYEQIWKHHFWANCLQQFLKQFSSVEKKLRWLINSKTMWLKPLFKPFLVSILLPCYIRWFAFFLKRSIYIF